MDHLLSQLASFPLEFFARGGGGGSGGGGGGGSGSSSSSGGFGGIEAIFGYIPMHFVGALLAKLRKKNPALDIVVQIIGWVVAVAYFVLFVAFLRWIGGLIGAAGFLGMSAGLYDWYGKIKQSSMVKKQLATSAAIDAAWDETALVEFAKNIFLRYQEDWSNLNTNSMKTYMTPDYHYHASLLMYVLQSMGRRNLMSEVVIKDAQIVHINDDEDNTNDQFTIGFVAAAKDQLVEASDNHVIYTDKNTFTEFWTFQRNDKEWLLAAISQSTANPFWRNSALAQLASSQGYRYSEDMGWLFIPRRGQLFGAAKFGTSDINNHIVGLYKGQLLVQLYTYIVNPNNDGGKSYVIAQVNVPKQYGNIIVRRKSLVNMFGIKGLQKIETEWTKFNNKYEVYASSYEGATSFELLNPTYMEQLEALPFPVTIEVVDNVIYLSTNERKSDADTYQIMLDLINKAFLELRL